jgi:peptide/nickel transport system substrate-binding protein
VQSRLQFFVAALLTLLLLYAASATAECPTVSNPGGLKTQWPHQLELSDFERQRGPLEVRENPLFAAKVAQGGLLPVSQRLPSDPLILLPYHQCGRYGGVLRGLSLAPDSGTSEIMSWRQVNLVRLSEDLQTIVPNVARAWEWGKDQRSITIHLRKGHRWSDGHPFTADDVVFFIDDIIRQPAIHNKPPLVWTAGGEPVKVRRIDETTLRFEFAAPFPGFLMFLASSGSYLTPYAPRHVLAPLHIVHNPDADEEAKAFGFENWVERFRVYWNKWKDELYDTEESLKVPTLDSHMLAVAPTKEDRRYIANPYYFKLDSAGQQLPYIDSHHERFVAKELFLLEIVSGRVDQKSQNVGFGSYRQLKDNEHRGGYDLRLPTGGGGVYLAFNQTHKDPVLRKVFSDPRFLEAMSIAIDRRALNLLRAQGHAEITQGLPERTSFVTAAHRQHNIEFDPEKANRLLDEMGLERSSSGVRLLPDGRPLVVNWAFSRQFAGTPELPSRIRDNWADVGVEARLTEITTKETRTRAWANKMDINMEWDTPFEPNLTGDPYLFVPPYSSLGPLFGVPWKLWMDSDGKMGEEPLDWVKRLYALAEEWRTLQPGSPRYRAVSTEMVQINLEHMTIIGVLGLAPSPTVVSRTLKNVSKWTINHYNFGRTYPFRPDQWFFAR